MAGALVVVGSVKGAPGATTLAVALAACWPTGQWRPRPLVVEADPSGGDAAARFSVPGSPGLVELAAAVRRPASPRVLADCVQVLPGEVPVVVGPSGGPQAAAAVQAFAASGAELLRAGMGTSGSVLVDVGRFREETAPLVAAADRLLLVVRGEVDALAHACGKVEELRAAGRSVELAVVGQTPYPPSEIGTALGADRVHQVPWDPKTAQSLWGHAARSDRRRRSSPLVHAATSMAGELAEAGSAVPGQRSGAAGAQPAGLDLPTGERR